MYRELEVSKLCRRSKVITCLFPALLYICSPILKIGSPVLPQILYL